MKTLISVILISISFVLCGCSRVDQISYETNINMQDNHQSDDSSKLSTEKQKNENKSCTSFTFNNLALNQCNNYKGVSVQWKGVISNKSQLDGIKFWIIDSIHQKDKWQEYDWFWAVPSDLEEIGQLNDGDWVKYMLNRFGNINSQKVIYGQDIFLITGTLEDSDCNYYGGGNACIPQIIVQNIKLIND